MKSNVFRPISTPVQKSSTGTGDVQSFAAPDGAQACFLTVETTSCYLTLDGTTPSSSAGVLVPTGVVHFLPVGAGGITLKVASTAGTAAKVNVIWLG